MNRDMETRERKIITLILILFVISYTINIIRDLEVCMNLRSVKETAERFNISERRVQKLCESGRIDGARMISNVWLIPSTAAKPFDERSVVSSGDLVSLSDLCKELSISVATGRNWVKLGKLRPTSEIKRTAFFDREYVADIKSQIRSGKSTVLKRRRNKKYVSGSDIYNSYVSDDSINLPVVQAVIARIEGKKIEVSEGLLCAVIAECAIQLILNKQYGIKAAGCLSDYIHGNLRENKYLFLIDDLIYQYPLIKGVSDMYPEIFEYEYTYEEGEDILGLLYISLKNIGSRKATGSYYTPTAVVKKVCRSLFDRNDSADKDIFDPCCGTGNFILQLPSNIDSKNVYGNDIDSLSVKIARINYALKYDICDASIIYEHITEEDYLAFDINRKYDFIIGNPPWGYEFSDLQKEQLRYKYGSAVGTGIESYDVFVEQALSDLKIGGVLSFVLPEAILNVRTHTPIRRIMLDCCSFQYLEFLGNAFDKVQCPCIILQSVYTGNKFSSIGMIVQDGSRKYSIQRERKVNADCLSFSMTDEEYLILEKMDNLQKKVTLAGRAVFALGIVTGDNKTYISQEKKTENEMVLKGSDLYRFKCNPSENYIIFKPESFQQVAPTKYYRAAENLLYRFICNQLVFAYDDKQTLSLNSCNILIPEIDGLSMKYVLAILNSRIAQFYFKKQFNSVKVLRSHIEQIPIAFIEKETQERIIEIVDSILEASDSDAIVKLYENLDMKIAGLYGLGIDEYQIIKSSMEGDNLFLY